jgi:hypothetical protein
MINPINAYSGFVARKVASAQTPAFDVSGHASVEKVLNQIRDEQSSMQNLLGHFSGGSAAWNEGRSGQIGFA